jgi:SAM-dependent methyltransferase
MGSTRTNEPDSETTNGRSTWDASSGWGGCVWSRANCYVRRVAAKSPFANDRWQVCHLDSELRYRPAVDALHPEDGRPVCEVGSGPSGLAGWTERLVIGIDPGEDERHGPLGVAAPNLRRERSSGTQIPLADASVGSAVAVDTLEHVPVGERPKVIAEMARVTAPGGRVILIGPVGAEARKGDLWLLDTVEASKYDVPWAQWLHEHVQHGLPSVEELGSMLLTAGARRVTARGVFNLYLWRIMHLAGLGELPEPRFPFYDILWRPFALLARRYRRGPFYRWLVIGEM